MTSKKPGAGSELALKKTGKRVESGLAFGKIRGRRGTEFDSSQRSIPLTPVSAKMLKLNRHSFSEI